MDYNDFLKHLWRLTKYFFRGGSVGVAGFIWGGPFFDESQGCVSLAVSVCAVGGIPSLPPTPLPFLPPTHTCTHTHVHPHTPAPPHTFFLSGMEALPQTPPKDLLGATPPNHDGQAGATANQQVNFVLV